MVKFCSLFSSSSGNCEYLTDGSTTLLIDAGVSCKRVTEALQGIGQDPGAIAGVLITHEHSDHIKGVSVLCRKYGIPVYANAPTAEHMDIVKKEQVEFRIFKNGQPFAIGDIEITPFETPHDAVSPVGYRFAFPKEGKSIGLATDMGCVTDTVHNNLMGCDLAFIESNHDRNMLLNGPYPYHLKRRILSDHGHLCNDDCGQLARDLIQSGTKQLVLGHLSHENNLPQIAYMTSRHVLEQSGMVEMKDYLLSVAGRDRRGELLTL